MADQSSQAFDPNQMSAEQQQALGRTVFQAQVIDRASKDQDFRQRLISDPKGTISKEFGVTIPGNISLNIVQDTPTAWYLVLPPVPAAVGSELSEEQLEAVAGGWTNPTDCGTCWTNCETCVNPASCITGVIASTVAIATAVA
jgi:hypothetical protein